MNNKKFRNHISIIIENIGGSFIFIMTLLFGNLINNIKDIDISNINYKVHLNEIIISFLVLFIICTIFIIYQINIWYKTFIYIDSNSIVIEKNTINKKKNVIGISNISNVNTEQNLFEMLIGTCKVKLDTNTLSTADKTDLKIVLKKDKAEEFSNYILSLINKDNIKKEEAIDINKDRYDIIASNKDLIKNGLYSINLISILILIVSFIITVNTSINNLINKDIGKSILDIILNSIISFGVFVSAFWSLLKGFIKYYDFSIKRRDDKLYLRYGLLKKVKYTIPVDKINGIKINQTLIARLKKRYIVEIINIGIGDEKGEPQSTILLYSDKEKIKKDLELILPEFSRCIDLNIEKQPKKVWYVWSFPFIVYLSVACLYLIFIHDFINEILLISLFIVLAIIFLLILSAFLNYKTDGIIVDDEYLGVSKGFFGRSFIFIKYYKVQYIDFIQNPIAYHLNIQKGKISILASTLNRFHTLPYFDIKYSDNIKEKLLKSNK